MQCLHLLRRYFVPLPWRFLAQPELQQGSDRLNCKQKHFLVLHAIKLIVYTSMNKLRAYFRVICAPIRSWSDISAQHFPSLPPGELGFWRPEISSRRPEILYQLINRSVTDPRYYNGRGISRPNVEMNHNNIFMRHIFWSTWNAKVIAQSQRPGATGRNGGLFGADAEKNSLSWPLNRLQWSLYQQAGGTRSKYNYWRRKGLTEQ